MAPKKAIAVKGRSKSTAPTYRLIDEDTDATKDTEYVPPTRRTSPTIPRSTQNQSKKVVPKVVTASESVEKDTLIGSATGSTFGSEFTSAAGSASGSTTGSSSHGRAALSDEAASSEKVPMPQNNDPAPVAEELNRLCVEGQWKIYRDAKMLNEKEKLAHLIIEERRVVTGILHTVPDIHRLFQHHKCEWMGKELGTYSEEIVREFYTSYAATLRGSIQRNANPRAQTPLKKTLVRWFSVDISEITIYRFFYGPGHTWALNTTKFEYRWDIVWGGEFQRSAKKKEIVLRWFARYIATDGVRVGQL
uniref:Integrase core domain containing protein n=1 Tax=Solanum tuberosum TaxID=4113 RepID=M1D841_SOLTU